MSSSAAPEPFVLERIEAPHIVYPKGPVRTVRIATEALDAVAGRILLATLDPCGHEVALGVLDTTDMIVRCPQCYYETHKAADSSEHGVDAIG